MELFERGESAFFVVRVIVDQFGRVTSDLSQVLN